MYQSKLPHWKIKLQADCVSSIQSGVLSISYSLHPAMLEDSSWADPGPSQLSAVTWWPQDVLWVRCHENWAVGPDQTGLSLRWLPATDSSWKMQVCASMDHWLDVAIFRQNCHNLKQILMSVLIYTYSYDGMIKNIYTTNSRAQTFFSNKTVPEAVMVRGRREKQS